MWARQCVAVAVLSCALAAAHGAARAAGAEVRLWAGGGARLYDVDSAVLLNEAARRDQEVGWRLAARLAVRATACHAHEALLHFELMEPTLQLRGAARSAEWVPRAAGPHSWDAPAQRRSSFYAHWSAGRVLRAYLDPADPPAVAGFKRGLVSLFQFQILDGERNETDISGDCDVLYETLTELEFRKIKRGCVWAGSEAGGVSARRVVRYSLAATLDALSGALGEELLELGAAGAGDADAAVKARAWTRLQLRDQPAADQPACPRAQPGLLAARQALPIHLQETTLPLPPVESTENVPAESGADGADGADQEDDDEEQEDDEEELSVARALRLAGARLAGGGPGAGGDRRAAAALLRALPALRAAHTRALRDHLMALDDLARLTGCARALGAAGTLAAHEALLDALALRGAALQPAADQYLAALGGALAPQPAAVRAVLALASDGSEPRVRAAALLAAAAAAPRAAPPLAAAVRADIAKILTRCKDEQCVCTCLSALGNLRRSDTAELLLAHAEREPAAPALAALRALQLAPAAALPWARAARLLRVALNAERALDVRAAALDLAVQRSAAVPVALTHCARALHAERSAGAAELRRVLWQRLAALAPQHDQVRVFLRAALHDPELGSWHARAHNGTSSVLVRDAGWGAGGWRAALDSLQLAAGGVLRRGRVQLRVARGADEPLPALAVELWTRGLGALAGGAGDAADADEDAAGGLAIELAGARLPDITLFSSQAELLGHVWAGTGSAPTPVTRAAAALSAARAELPLLGGVPVTLRAAAAAALALDAHATVSLWSRTASARLQLRAAVLARAHAALRAPWGRAAARAEAAAPGELSIAADLDFYSGVALCVRAAVPDHQYARAATLRAELGARRWRVLRRRDQRWPRAGRTLALGPLNDVACRTLAPHE